MKKNMVIGIVMCFAVAMISGCRKPYDTPSFVTVDNNETAFVIQAEGDTSNQDVFQSAELLEKQMVASKRIQISHRWVQTSRRHWQGEYIDSVIVIKVNRAPVTRTWTSEPGTGTSKNMEAIEAESLDSLAVSSGFTLTAYIKPEDTAKFLFRYKGDSLSSIMDTQIKNTIQAVYTEECSKYNLLDLPKYKQAITDTIRAKVIPFYKEWGITIGEDMGLVGGLNYTKEIQAEIDAVFKAQKGKERAYADAEAQAEINRKNESIAETDKRIKMIAAEGEAFAITQKAEAIKIAGSTYIQAQFIEKWDGMMPKVASGEVMQMLPVNMD